MIAVVKYNAGNIFSVQCALQRLGVESVLSDDREVLRKADKVIFPGVGEASSAMACLREKGLDEVIKSLTQPTLGICIGLQLMCRHSEEGDVDCLGIFDTPVKRFVATDECTLKIPEMGWNTIHILRETPLVTSAYEGQFVYYVHSYYAQLCKDTAVSTDYINGFSAVLQRDNFFATQFHPEKSGPLGEQILHNFLNI